MKYYHVDVFSKKPFSGNGLTIFNCTTPLSKSQMQALTIEMRQFESIFLMRMEHNVFRAHIFTMEEELDFAGHPIIGASAILHDLYAGNGSELQWHLQLNKKMVHVTTKKYPKYFSAQMNQGRASYSAILHSKQEQAFLGYLNLSASDKEPDLPIEVISTGLPYLIVPVKSESLSKVTVTIKNLEEKLSSVNAKFFYVLDTQTMRGRTWDNQGMIEDIATGSAAGPVGAYLVKNHLAKEQTEIILKQGDYLARPSFLKILVKKDGDILVEGNVSKVAEGTMLAY
jgi:PhzF family phenazine biosynthesis protein